MGEFWLSAYEQRSNLGDFFTEPVLLKTNVENGKGYFGAYNRGDTIWIRR